MSPDDTRHARHQAALMDDLNALCDFGGRLAGTSSEAEALAWLRDAGAAALGVACTDQAVSYRGWRAKRAELRLPDGEQLQCHPLVRCLSTPEGGTEAEVVDIGRGIEEDFEKHRADLKGRIVLFRHEVMFSPDTFHRRRKLALAREAGAVAALVAATIPGEVVTGSSRGEGEAGLPALGISPEAAVKLAPRDDRLAHAVLVAETEEFPAQSATLTFDLPGESGEWVVLSAHADGHDINESAMDNASGVAVCLEVARRIRTGGPYRHGLRLAFFSVEEWGLTGSDLYLASLPQPDLDRMLVNVNLDTVVGGTGWTALTSEFPHLSGLIQDGGRKANTEVRVFEPLQRNSDHANFAARGIPAFRLLSGFDEPESDVRFVLTGRDCRDLVNGADMEAAADLATALVETALNVDDATARSWRDRA